MKLLLLLLPALLLAGCASKEPLDYLPQGTAYVAVNVEDANKDAGSKRLFEALQQLGGQKTQLNRQARHLYFSLAGTGPGASYYGVMTGPDGFGDQALNDLKAEGGVEGKHAGMRTVTTDRFGLSLLGSNGLLLFPNTAGLDQMIAVSKQKSPGARNTSLFQRSQEMITTHSVAVVLNPAPFISMASQQLNFLAMLNAKGTEALKQADLLAVGLDWAEQPRIEARLEGPTEGTEELATLLNTLLGQAKGKLPAGALGGLNKLVEDLEVAPDAGGVAISLEFPQEEAEAYLKRLESTASSLPSDPTERQKAIREAFSMRPPR